MSQTLPVNDTTLQMNYDALGRRTNKGVPNQNVDESTSYLHDGSVNIATNAQVIGGTQMLTGLDEGVLAYTDNTLFRPGTHSFRVPFSHEPPKK